MKGINYGGEKNENEDDLKQNIEKIKKTKLLQEKTKKRSVTHHLVVSVERLIFTQKSHWKQSCQTCKSMGKNNLCILFIL